MGKDYNTLSKLYSLRSFISLFRALYTWLVMQSVSTITNKHKTFKTRLT